MVLSNDSRKILFGLVIVGFGMYAIWSGVSNLFTTTLVILSILAMTAGDVKEIRIAKIAHITFDREKERPPPGGTE